jgi:replicative superfamily II helicase
MSDVDSPTNRTGGNEEKIHEPRTERRERRRQAARRRVAKHGASIRRVYRDAVEKRARKAEERRTDVQ